ncbi:MAG: glycosyltransferase [Gemmatimonadetes bacterium]|nr:glycosyltransferase family 4 protein [Gemmatimonadota bacterium]NIQ57103.1 glycosyltransferase family 4 protein [Gemmatimonadota bacterium]NIU77270.1 glycosyltransferase [Gammaproteobacteria bacterium]NIX46544.1 glycosyltransferase [Gemmatimonadota bacterium]NIY10862.1 glycosyltransferase [Gemmatimonadota bacterium]
MIGIVHGYGLAGAGSNLWTRETVAALCDNGETVHLMCQETDPERFDFIAEAWTHTDDEADRVFSREVPYPGRCILHRPALNVLPTYVRPDRESDYVRSILDLDMDALEEYLRRNVVALRRVSDDTGIRAWHVNHTILLSEALRRLREETGIAYAVMPHGSSLEYIVRHDERMRPIARRALESADAIFALNQEVRDRLADFFPDLDLEPRTVTVRVGVDTQRFRPVPRPERPASVERLAAALEGVPRGRGPAHAAALREAVDPELDHDGFRSALEPALDYATDRPDADLEDRLRTLDLPRARILTFVGRIIPAKGVPAIVVALPRIVERHPQTRLLLVGAGWLREYLEAFVLALSRGDGELAARIIEWTTRREQEGARPSGAAFIRRLRDTGEYDAYVDAARRCLTPEHVLFTGFLEHPLLAHVFPLADVAVFPSAVAEASPLVVPEAAACGCLPMGTDFAGMHHSLASLAPRLPDSVARLMPLDPDPERTAPDIVRNVDEALRSDADITEALRRAAVEEYDWHGIARTLVQQLGGLQQAAAAW